MFTVGIYTINQGLSTGENFVFLRGIFLNVLERFRYQL